MKKVIDLRTLFSRSGLVTLLFLLWGCTQAPPIKTLAYGDLSSEKTFEYSFPTVWKGIEEAFRKYKINERDPSDATPSELKKLTRRTLETDWIYGESRNKYEETQINGIPKKIPLQGRYKFKLVATRNLAGVLISIQVEEEIEGIHSDGSSAGYHSTGAPDPSRAAELLNKINNSILSLPNTE
jgi:hypothetical protein